MTTIQRNGYSRTTGRSTVQKNRPQQKKYNPRALRAATLPPARENKHRDIKIRFGHIPLRTSMYQPLSILKRRRYDDFNADAFTDPLYDWYQPSNLEPVPSRSLYSPVGTPARLRSLVTSPALTSYRNSYNLRQVISPLPSIDWHRPPVGLDTWGLNSLGYHSTPNLSLIRRHPSPLSQFGSGHSLPKQKKPYIVVPHLTNFVSPPITSDVGNPFLLPSRQHAAAYYPDARQTYLQRIHSFTSPEYQYVPSDYIHLRQNEGFANTFVDDFIGRSITDQFIPDILIEILSELDHESKSQGGKAYRPEFNRYYTELSHRLNQQRTGETHLPSDDWIRRLDSQHPPVMPSRPVDFQEMPQSRLRYHELPNDVQGRLIADINQELVDFEIANMARELSDQALNERQVIPLNIPTRQQYPGKKFAALPNDTLRQRNNRLDSNQQNSVDEQMQNKLLDTVLLNQLLTKYLKQNGSVVDVDDSSRLLDGALLDNLMHQYRGIEENRSQTLDNYA